MKKNKIILCFVSLLLVCLSTSTLSAATIIRTGSVNSSYLTTYRDGYNYSVVLTDTGSATITVVMNRSNNRNPKDNDFTTTVVRGDLHYIQEDVEKFAQVYGVDIASIKQYHVNNDEK